MKTPLLTAAVVAEWLDCSLATISRMCATGDLPHIVLRAGRRKKIVRFKPEDVEKWLVARSCTGQRESRPKRKSPPNGNKVATEKERFAQAGEIKTENMETH